MLFTTIAQTLAFSIFLPIIFVAAELQEPPEDGPFKNDWTKGCWGGCTHFIGASESSDFASITVKSKDPTRFVDFSGAGGWVVANCPKDGTEALEVRAACKELDKCNRLLDGNFAGRMVRLPKGCADSPFALIKSVRDHPDQSKIGEVNSVTPIKGIELDFDMGNLDPEVDDYDMVVVVANNVDQARGIPEAIIKRSLDPLRHALNGRGTALARAFGDANSVPKKRSRRETRRARARRAAASQEFVKRSFFNKVGNFFKDIGKDIKNVALDGVDAIHDAAKAVKNEADKFTQQLGKEVKQIVKEVGKATEVNEKKEKIFDIVKIDEKNVNIIDATVKCDVPVLEGGAEIQGGIKIDADVKADLAARVGFMVKGKLIPPKVDEIAFTGALNGGAEAALRINANAKGEFTTGDITLVEAGLVGLSVPGFITVGPAIQLVTRADANFSINAKMDMNVAYQLPELEFVFPPGSRNQFPAKVTPVENKPLKLEVGASVDLKGQVEAHLIPRVKLGITIGPDGVIGQANVFMEVDGSARLGFEMNANAGTALNDGSFTNVGSSFKGNVRMDMGVSVNAGATASLLNLINADKKLQLFQAEANIFSKDFGGSSGGAPQAPPQSRRSLSIGSGASSALALDIRHEIDENGLRKRQTTGMKCASAAEGLAKNLITDGVTKVVGDFANKATQGLVDQVKAALTPAAPAKAA